MAMLVQHRQVCIAKHEIDSVIPSGHPRTVKNPLNEQTDSDNALMLAYAAGAATAFDELYARYRKPLYQFVLHGCSNSTTAAELFQDIWTSVIKARNEFQDTGTFKSWLYRIARNKLIDFYRQQPNQEFDEYNDESVQDNVIALEKQLTPQELTELADSQEQVQRAIQALPWRQRDTVILKYVAGFTLAEIALEQGDPVETVKSRLRYAYTRLRQMLRAKQ